MFKEKRFLSSDKVTMVNVKSWHIEHPKATLIVAHGIGEHSGRYKEFAESMAKKEIAVYAIDFIGHGKSTSETKAPMYFGGVGSFKYLVKDLIKLNEIVKQENEDIPCFILGFSMGSFVLREAIVTGNLTADKIDGAILVGTGSLANSIAKLMNVIIGQEVKKIGGDDKVSEKINLLAFENYNKFFKPTKTAFDWLCESEDGIRNYMEDQMAQKYITPGMFRELLNSMAYVSQKKIIAQTLPIPILFLSGENDPVGGFTKNVNKTVKEFKKYNSNVECKFYSHTRHDIFHDTEKQKAMEDVYTWIMQKINNI